MGFPSFSHLLPQVSMRLTWSFLISANRGGAEPLLTCQQGTLLVDALLLGTTSLVTFRSCWHLQTWNILSSECAKLYRFSKHNFMYGACSEINLTGSQCLSTTFFFGGGEGGGLVDRHNTSLGPLRKYFWTTRISCFGLFHPWVLKPSSCLVNLWCDTC